MADFIQIRGLKEMGQRMLALPKNLQGPPIVNTLRTMGKIVQRDAKSRVPVDTGTLRENIIVSRIPPRRRGPTEEGVEVTVRYKATKYKDTAPNRKAGRVGGSYQDYGPLFYARFLEFGTSKMAARPFLRPAFEAAKGSFPQMFSEGFSRELDKVVNKLARSR